MSAPIPDNQPDEQIALLAAFFVWLDRATSRIERVPVLDDPRTPEDLAREFSTYATSQGVPATTWSAECPHGCALFTRRLQCPDCR